MVADGELRWEAILDRNGIVVSKSPWGPDDEIFLDGLCPYFRHWFAPYTRPGGPSVLGVRVPFVNYWGPTIHRLVRLAPLP